MIDINKIPEHWEVKKLGDIGKVVSGGTPSTNISEYWNGEISWISPADLSGYESKYIARGRKSISESGLKNSSAKLLPKGAVLFSSRAPIGYVVIALNDVCTNQGFKSIIPNKSILSDFLYFFLKSAKQDAEKVASGTTFKEISLKAFSELTIPIPPIFEQQAIVAKIEELLSDLENGKQQLLTAQTQLKIYRQSLLKWAFEGKLTNKDVKEGELPEGWKRVKLNKICTSISDGDHLPPPKSDSGIPFITISNIKNNTIDFSNTMFMTEDYYYAIKDNRKPQKGDILYTVTGSFGIPVLIDYEKKFCFQRHIGLIRVKDGILQKWLYYFLQSPQIFKQATEMATGTAQKTVALKSLRDFDIALPLFIEQEQIVSELENKLTVCDKLEETISQSLLQADTLKQSILKRAFEGKLLANQEIESNIIQPVPISIPNVSGEIKPIDLHAGIIAMVIDAHEKNPLHRTKLNHVKGEKIAHLVEYKLGISLGRTPVKDAAGPDDYNHLKKVEHRANMANWFGVKNLDIGHTYYLKPGAGNIINKVEANISKEELADINKLITTFLPFTMEQAEIVATLFAGWNNLLLEGKLPTDEEIVFESRENWSARKLTIERDRFFNALQWMKTHNYMPEGRGKMVLKSEKTKPDKKKTFKKGSSKGDL
ncbi:restriction endonuclease subunit S [Emticicia sp. BO119]|uniref:restriction endonuclease subunit S n=1 Tax=Emticicia sp. BO119 TaxID=2757768 RepID=UPI0015F11A08|nr:restriction endonuclease subunit S [Emticicia sp. BO119]MBA4852395.1 restriction endonuclease subunit S [Emticicia sp. BO119]